MFADAGEKTAYLLADQLLCRSLLRFGQVRSAQDAWLRGSRNVSLATHEPLRHLTCHNLKAAAETARHCARFRAA